MTAKEFVRLRHPKAQAERHIKGRVKGMQEVYWLIRPEPGKMYLESGKTESNAWKNSKDHILRWESENKSDEA